MFRTSLKQLWIALLLLGALATSTPMLVHAQSAASAAEAESKSLLQLGAIVHRRITMLARRVHVDLRNSRRFGATRRATCLSDVLSDLHSTQRAVDAWTLEARQPERVNARIRGMLSVFRAHLKELRAEARGCLGGGDLAYGVVEVEVEIEGPQPDEDPHVVPSSSPVADVPWVVPQR